MHNIFFGTVLLFPKCETPQTSLLNLIWLFLSGHMPFESSFLCVSDTEWFHFTALHNSEASSKAGGFLLESMCHVFLLYLSPSLCNLSLSLSLSFCHTHTLFTLSSSTGPSSLLLHTVNLKKSGLMELMWRELRMDSRLPPKLLRWEAGYALKKRGLIAKYSHKASFHSRQFCVTRLVQVMGFWEYVNGISSEEFRPGVVLTVHCGWYEWQYTHGPRSLQPLRLIPF